MKKVSIITMVFSFVFLLNSYGQQPKEVVTLKEYIPQVLAYYPSLKKEQASVEKAIAQKAIASSSRMPQLWSSVKMEYGDDPVFTFGSLLRQNRFSNDDFALGRLNTPSPVTDYSAGLQGEWLLFDFSQTSLRIKSSGLLAESAQFKSQFTQMQAIIAACEIYSRLFITNKLVESLEMMTQSNQLDIDAINTLSQKGLMLGVDFYLARMSHHQLIQLKNEAIAQQSALLMVFNILRGKDPVIPVTIEMNLDKNMTLEGDLNMWMEKTSNNRFDVQALKRVLDAGIIDAKREKKSFLPKVVAYGHGDENLHSIDSHQAGNYVVGVKAKMDLFDPALGSRKKDAKAQVNILEAEYQSLKDKAASDTAEVYYRLQALKNNINLSQEIYNDAKEALRLITPLYREGRKSISDIVGVRLNLVESYERLLKLSIQEKQDFLNLKLFAGELTQEEAEKVYE